MTDHGLGPWNYLLVGHQWPQASTLDELGSIAHRRNKTGMAFQSYAETLESIIGTSLTVQEGETAEDTRQAFLVGQDHAHNVFKRNSAKALAFGRAQAVTAGLRSNLEEIANRGDCEIRAIIASKQTSDIKIAEILKVVSAAQNEANIRAASSIQELLSALQDVLYESGHDMSARQFAQSNGSEFSGLGLPAPRKQLERRVNELFTESATDRTSSDGSFSSAAQAGSLAKPPPSLQAANNSDQFSTTVQSAALPGGEALPTHIDRSEESLRPLTSAVRPRSPGPAPGAEDPTIHFPSAIEASSTAIAPTQGAISSLPTRSNGEAGSSIASSLSEPRANQLRLPQEASTAIGTPGEAFARADAENGISHPGTSASLGPGAEAISTAATTSLHTPHAGALTTPLAEATAPQAPIFENAHPATPLIESAQPHLPSDAPQAVITSSSPPVAAPMPAVNPIAPASPIPQGPLPGYGSDLRPPVATVSAPPPPMPAAPGSVPVAPASGTAGSGQPTVVRQQPTATPAAHSAVGLTERAFAATATGAAASAAAGASSADTRLRRLLGSVARQRPELRWAIGDLSDGSTVLTTDLADGWVPPGIEIPTGVRLLQPAVRHKGLLSLLGETTSAVSYSPGQYLSPDDTAPMSIRARDTAPVDDLGWELLQATRWRDGLPRLAHTLARAVSAQTGLIDSEVDLLSTHLNSVARTILAKYPTIEPTEVGNWQLLATIDALIKGQTTSANYHFAWFATQALIREGRS